MPSLIALIENEFVSRYSSKSKRLEDVLATDEDCAAFIRQVLDDASYSIAGATRNKKQYDFSKDRAKHSVITYFMGLILAKFGDLEARINSLMPESGTFEHLWMLTALYHDWGYYSDRINNGSLKLRSVVKHYLLSDIDLDSRLGKLANYEISHPEALAYSYDEIEEYRIVGSKEADPSNNKISNASPLAKAIMNAKVGDVRSVESPNGTYDVEIVEIL